MKKNYKLSTSNKWWIFSIFISLMLTDRIINLINFGFVYTDIDQVILWNGAVDYSKGIFHEPFFYGQPFNFMLESIIAIPLLWINIPVHIALPISTSLISLIPFIFLSLFLLKREYYFWAFLCLAFPVLLPIEYNFLTTISRGNVQAHFIIPFIFIPLFNPESKKNVIVLYLTSAICFILNPSSLIIILPISIFIFTYHLKSISFYLKSLIVIPIYFINYLAQDFYKNHPENILHELVGLSIDSQVFISSFKNLNLFEYLFPFCSQWGILYPFLFLLLAIYVLNKSMKKEFVLILTFLILLLVTLAIPKVQEFIPNTGFFFTSSRLYLFVPILFIITLFLIFKNVTINKFSIYMLLVVCGATLIVKNSSISKTVQTTISKTIFPIDKNQDIIKRTSELKKIALKYNIDLIVHTTFSTWDYRFDSYCYNPIIQDYNFKKEKTISVCIDDDRRSWLFQNSANCKQILLNGIIVDESKLKLYDYVIINKKLNQIIIKNNQLNITELFSKLDLKFGNTAL